MTKVVKRFFRDVTITSAGLEVGGIIDGDTSLSTHSGYIRQLLFEQTSGSATTLDSIEIRYESGNSDSSNLVYNATASALTSNVFSDSYIDAPFSLVAPEPFEDIILFVQTDATGVFTIRVDLEIGI